MNNNLKHTPGPWEITGAHSHLFATTMKRNEYIENEWKAIIGEMWGRPWGNDVRRKEESQANARLVATAPDMLNYLIKQALFEMQETDGIPGELVDLIEKATGQKIEDIIG